MEIIAHIHTDFPTKFGIPRQSGISDELKGRIVFTSPYRNPDAVRGLDGFSHIWLIWCFSEATRSGDGHDGHSSGWSATVRPPRLGGNTRVGVFASRSPFRPNPIGLSAVRLDSIEYDESLGPILHVSGADTLDGTPIYDIKPYIPFADSHPEATAGFSAPVKDYALDVAFPDELLALVPEDKRAGLFAVLAHDPRPSYQHDPKRVYGVPFAGQDIRFSVDGSTLTVREVVPYDGSNPR